MRQNIGTSPAPSSKSCYLGCPGGDAELSRPRHEGQEHREQETNQAIKIPNTYDEAMSSPQREEWKEACSKEMDNLRKHNVYNLVPLSSVPKGEKILGTKFVFKKKLDGRFKARLVVGGHRQKPGQDYGRSYAPVCRIGSILDLSCDWLICPVFEKSGAALSSPTPLTPLQYQQHLTRESATNKNIFIFLFQVSRGWSRTECEPLR